MTSNDRSPIFLLVLTAFGVLFPAMTGPSSVPLSSPGGELVPEAADAAVWLTKAEELVAGHAAICVHPLVAQLRALLYLEIGSALLWALAIGSYMFQPERLLTTVVVAAVIVIVLTALFVFIELERDEMLSALNKTDPEITWRTFLADALMWIVLPCLAFIAVQYPAATNHVASWLGPAAKIFQ